MSKLKIKKDVEEFLAKKSINNDETLSALSAISAAAAQCMNSLEEIVESSSVFSPPHSPADSSTTVERLEKAKRMDMLYHKMSISKKGSGEKAAKDLVAVPPSPPSPPSPPPRPEANMRLTK